jgi:hypothetical protein
LNGGVLILTLRTLRGLGVLWFILARRNLPQRTHQRLRREVFKIGHHPIEHRY